MTKILLMCDMGISGRMLIQKMQDEAAARGIETEISTRPVHDYRDCAAQYDVALLAPQIRHRLRDCQQVADPAGKPLACIDTDAYWNLDAVAVLEQALALAE